MTPGRHHWIAAFAIASALHLGIGFWIQFDAEERGAKGAGYDGHLIGLSLSGGAPGQATAVEAEPDETETPALADADAVGPQEVRSSRARAVSPVEPAVTSVRPVREITARKPVQAPAVTPAARPSEAPEAPQRPAESKAAAVVPVARAATQIETRSAPTIEASAVSERPVEDARPVESRAAPTPEARKEVREVAAAAAALPRVAEVRPVEIRSVRTNRGADARNITARTPRKARPSQNAAGGGGSSTGSGGGNQEGELTGEGRNEGDLGGGRPGLKASYIAGIKAHIEARTSLIADDDDARPEQHSALLYFRIREGGLIREFRVLEGTGNPSLDARIAVLIREALPLPDIPDELNLRELQLIMPIRFVDE